MIKIKFKRINFFNISPSKSGSVRLDSDGVIPQLFQQIMLNQRLLVHSGQCFLLYIVFRCIFKAFQHFFYIFIFSPGDNIFSYSGSCLPYFFCPNMIYVRRKPFFLLSHLPKYISLSVCAISCPRACLKNKSCTKHIF